MNKINSLKLLVLIVIILITKQVYSQNPTFNWVGQPGGPSVPGQSLAFNTATDSKGNVYTVGFFTGTVDFNPSPTEELVLTAMNDQVIANQEFAQAMLINSAKMDWDLVGDAFITKLDSFGNFVWAKRVGGKQSNRDMTARFKEIQLDKDDNVFIVGAFKDSIDFNPSLSEPFEVISSYDGDTPQRNNFVLKLNQDGIFQWVKTYDETYFNLTSIAIDSEENVFLTCKHAISVIKINGGSGEEIWYKNIGGGPFGTASSIALDKDDNILLTGFYGGTNIDFNPDPMEEYLLTSNGASNPYVESYQFTGDIFVLKLTHEAEFIWVKAIKTDAKTSDYGYDVATDSEGNVLVVGNIHGPIGYNVGGVSGQYDFNPDSTAVHNVVIESGNGAFLLKLDTDGKFVWVNKLAELSDKFLLRVSNGGNSVCVDQCDNIYVTGYFGGTCDFDPDPTKTFSMTSTQPLPDPSLNITVKGDIYVSKFSPEGYLSWAGQFGTGVGTDIRVDDKKNIYLAGVFGSGFTLWVYDDLPNAILPDFDPSSSGIHTMKFGKKYSYFSSKLSQKQNSFYITAADSTICAFDTIQLTAVGNYSSFTWKPENALVSSTGKEVSAIPFETTRYTVLAPNGICFDSASFVIFTNPGNPISIATADSILCLGESTSLQASGASSYNWSPSTGLNLSTGATVVATPTETTTYIVSEPNPTGNECPGVKSQTIVVNLPPSISISIKDTTIEQGKTIALEVMGGSSIEWSPSEGLSCTNCASPMATPQFSTTYCVTVSDSVDCPATACAKINILFNCGELFVPNSFSPNGDNLNDKLEVKVNPNCITEYNFQIFDRWGEKVFESTKISDSWDGKYDGKELDSAAFVYYLKVKLIDGTDYIVNKGNVSIVK